MMAKLTKGIIINMINQGFLPSFLTTFTKAISKKTTATILTRGMKRPIVHQGD